MGFCQFCGEEKTLIKAHIIPRPFFKELTPEKGHALIISDQYERDEFVQAGIIDKNILCAECDNNTFGKWDKYGINFFREAPKWQKYCYENNEFLHYRVLEYDYINLKLFFISLLWRMSISQNKFFKQVSLGPYEKTAFESLKNNNPGDETYFSVLISKLSETQNSAYVSVQGLMHKVILGPHKIRLEDIVCYRFNLNEFSCVVKVDQRPFPKSLNIGSLAVEPPLIILERQYDGSFENRLLAELMSK